jgi:cytoskeletal protein CcmA (bactofilin family)
MKAAEDSTVIGRSVKIRGEISGAEDLFLDGEVQGTVTLTANRLTVGPNARVLADLFVRDITVFGSIEGNIHSSGRVDLRQTASILGDIYTSRLSIEEKAAIKGRVDVGTSGKPNGSEASRTQVNQAEAHGAAAPLFGESTV